MKRMTWKEFKEEVEKQGVKEDDMIDFIDVVEGDDMLAEMNIHVTITPVTEVRTIAILG